MRFMGFTPSLAALLCHLRQEDDSASYRSVLLCHYLRTNKQLSGRIAGSIGEKHRGCIDERTPLQCTVKAAMDQFTTSANLPLSLFLGGALPVGSRAACVLQDAAALDDVMDGEGETTVERRTPHELAIGEDQAFLVGEGPVKGHRLLGGALLEELGDGHPQHAVAQGREDGALGLLLLICRRTG
jgi:hypothetical protein